MGDHGLPASLLPTHELRRRGGVQLLVRRDWAAALPLEAMLDGAPLPQWGRPVPHALRGRGAMHVLATGRGEIVAKRLQRGGRLGAFLRGWFADARRPLREAEAAELLLARGCATAPVVAARATRGPFGLHALELATARVPSRGDLLDVLRSRSLPLPQVAAAAGGTLRRLHDAGLRHRDLNARNLLVPAGSAAGGLVVLDLDRCRVGEPLGRHERVAALARLARSLVKNGVLPLRPGERCEELAALRPFFAA
jgi:3-deoxy-D-manno-octulosonic acid kinase